MGKINTLASSHAQHSFGKALLATRYLLVLPPQHQGLPQDEPLFSISQLPPEAFSGFVKTARLFLHATIGEKDTLVIRKNPYAKPQTGVFITALTQEKLVGIIKENTPKIIKEFKRSEIKERQRRTKKSKLRLDSLPSAFGLTLEIPSAYHIAKSEADFYWIRKALKSGHTNIIIYQVPLNTIPTRQHGS